MRASGTKEKVLKEGRALLQRHGYHGFSFQDIATKLKVKAPSLYDHYPSKSDLILAIIHEYSLQFDEWTMSVNALDPLKRVERVFDVFHYFVSDEKVCPILSLAADFKELPKEIQTAMQTFVKKWLSWLTLQIEECQNRKLIRCDLTASHLAEFIYSQGMGAQFQARVRGEPKLTLKSGHSILQVLKI